MIEHNEDGRSSATINQMHVPEGYDERELRVKLIAFSSIFLKTKQKKPPLFLLFNLHGKILVLREKLGWYFLHVVW